MKRVKPDNKKLGPRYGKIMKGLAQVLTSMSQPQIIAFERDGIFKTQVDGIEAQVNLDDVEIISEDIPGWLVANEGNITVALDITITEQLRQEGIARELVNRIQNTRKSKDFDITDKILVTIEPIDSIRDAVVAFKQYIADQVLANDILLKPLSDSQQPIEIDIDGRTILISVEINNI